jgi:DNA-binding transcriptional MerR regulator
MDLVSPDLPQIPDKRYFTIGEVSELCLVKPYVLRYWEQEFVQLRPTKRCGNRRYYQHHDVLLVRRIRELLYKNGFTISGARNRLAEMGPLPRSEVGEAADVPDSLIAQSSVPVALLLPAAVPTGSLASRALQASSPAMAEAAWRGPDLLTDESFTHLPPQALAPLREALLSIRDLLS